MSLYEENETNDGPQLKPMVINWKTVNGRWNEELCLQFLAYAKEKGYAEGSFEDDEEDEMRGMFYAQINRMVRPRCRIRAQILDFAGGRYLIWMPTAYCRSVSLDNTRSHPAS